MSHFESQKVHTFYKNNHTHFSNTRYTIWPYIRTFLSTTYNPTHLILDNGCGNGRCIMYNNIIGMDYSRELLQHITKGNSSRDSSVYGSGSDGYGSGSMYGSGSRDISRDISNKDNNYISNTNISNTKDNISNTKDNSTSNPSTINPTTYNPSTNNKTNNNFPSPLDLLRGDCLYIPFKNNTYNIIISIAVLHHISTLERRIIFLKEIYRILKYKGICLIGVWSIKHRNNKRFIECSGVGGSVGECGSDKGYVNTSNTIRDTTDNIKDNTIRDIKDIKDIKDTTDTKDNNNISNIKDTKDNNNISNIKDIPFSYGDVYATWNNVSVRYVHLFNIKELCDMCVSVGFTIEEVIEEHETLYVRIRK
ncbi:Alkylated DNA repair protein alkB 8 [Hamiltosporidium tvaerminnensis]|nr:Alkylated DNA repair protein alkB 8 [Hamiltosporidium tvaerminnensis]